MSATWLSRANALATFAGTVLAILALAVTCTDYLHKGQPVVEVNFVGTESLQKEFGHDRAHIVLNVTADLRSEFTWNTKQLFVFVNFEFSTRKNARNQMVMWNAIIEDKAEALIHLPTLRAQYPYALTDQGFNLKGKSFDITVAWNVMPRVGALYTQHRTFIGIGRLPEAYLQPTLGRVQRPGSTEMIEVGTGSEEEPHYYMEA